MSIVVGNYRTHPERTPSGVPTPLPAQGGTRCAPSLRKAPEATRGAPRGALPEAPASANVRVLVQGHECQITLRDHDEAALLTRLGAVLKRSDVRPLPKPAPRPQGQWKKPYQGR